MLNDFIIREHVKEALKEDIGFGDITTNCLVGDEEITTAYLNTRTDGVLCGSEIVIKVFELLSEKVETIFYKKDGDIIKKGETIAYIKGPSKAVLTGERTALNYIRQMSGIATETAKYIKAADNPNVKIADTRKTIPGFRMFEKYAVKTGGGNPHRFNLSDCVMIKDNHIKCAGSITAAVKSVKKNLSHAHKIEVECDTEEQVREAVESGVDIIMFDNMSPETIKKCVKIVNGRAITEASGNVNLTTIKSIAASGVDVISASAIHSGIKPLDIALDM